MPGAVTGERLSAPSVAGKSVVVPLEVRTAAILVGVVSPSVAAVLPERRSWELGQRWAAGARHQGPEEQRAERERKKGGQQWQGAARGVEKEVLLSPSHELWCRDGGARRP